MTTRRTHVTGPVDRFFLRHGTACGFVLDFDGPAPPGERLAARVLERAASHIPLRSLPPPPGRHRWTLRQEPLWGDAHVRRVACFDAGGAMTAAVAALLDEPLPQPPHPPWDVWLLHVPGRVRFRIVYRVHHALQDGAGAAHTMLALLSDRATPGPRTHRAALPTVAGALLAGRSCLAALRPAKGWNVLRRAPSHRTRWAYADVPEPRLRELARRYGATVNDVCLAGLAGALGRWYGTLPENRPVPELTVLLPMSVRQDHQRHAPGTSTTAHHLALACHLPDLEQAVRHVHRQTRPVRTHRVRDVYRFALGLLPAALGRHAAGALLGGRGAPLVVSSITLPADFTCFGGKLSAASLICDLYGGRLGYLSFTRAAGVVRCGLVHDDALPYASAVPGLWREALGAGAAADPVGPERSG
ncbi:wax ester/triacylglycerol synthase domain-containing protein [Streptomyces sp. NPDC052020]|uniref:wax ester/triacylglycerol synthase domain-containing protein n=1 Tax=Streptomyces sp. NPDC052020 TaxID=3155677 RepID=UPI003448FCBB